MNLHDEVEADLAEIAPRKLMLVYTYDSHVSIETQDNDLLRTHVQVKKDSFAGLIRHDVYEPRAVCSNVPEGQERVVERRPTVCETLRSLVRVKVPMDQGVQRSW